MYGSHPDSWGDGILAQASSTAFDAKRLDVPRDLNYGWLVQPGDNLSYSDPIFDDSSWTTLGLQTSFATALHVAHPQVV